MPASTFHLVAITAGPKTRVAGWSQLLRAESIEYVVASLCHEAEEKESDRVELWVHQVDVQRARSVLRRSVCYEEPALR
jgi:hypothetical protein